MARKGKLKKIAKNESKERPVRIKRYDYLFLIVCEDEKTEPSYFGKFKKQIPDETLFLKPVGTGRDPKGVVKRAILERDKLASEAGKEVDCVWVVFDKDDADENPTKVANFNSAFTIAEQEKFNVAYSNESFELWLLLHFIDIDYSSPIPRTTIYDQLNTEFKKIHGYEDYEYDHSNVDSRTIDIVFEAGDMVKAQERAEELYEYHKGKPPIDTNPCTMVHHLIKELSDWIKYFSYTS